MPGKMVYNRIGGNQTMKKTPKPGDIVEVCRYEESPGGSWYTVCVESALASQFTYDLEGADGKNIHDFMLYNSTDWRYPNAKTDKQT
jgi:hypothetical protein